MRRLRTPVSLAYVVALLLPFLVAASTGPAAPDALRGDRAPTVHADLRSELADAAPGATLDVVVTAWEARGLEVLDDLGVRHRRMRTMPIALARLTAEQAGRLALDTRIRSLWPVQSFDLLLDEGTAMVGADRVATDLGVDGEGVIVGVIDTGIDTTHPDLDGDKVLGNFQVVADLEGPVLIGSPFTDDHGHGTHVASTIAGRDEARDDANGDMSGVAPGAQLYGYAINAGTSVLSSLAIVAFDDLIARRQAGERVVAASNSWGGGDGTYMPDDPLAVATRALVDNGIVPVFAAGNDGAGLQTASAQCTIPWTFCVGAITKGRTLAGFSSRGRTPTDTIEYEPTEDPQDPDAGTPIEAGNHDVALGQTLEIGVYRPNVSAPGVDIEAACSTAAGCPGGYQPMSGTSMATPHVAGVIALVQSARVAAADGLLSASEAAALVENTANRLPGYELWETGTGEVDALEAVSLVLQADDGAVAIPTANHGATRTEVVGEPDVTTHGGLVLPNSWQTGVGAHVEEFEVGEGVGGMTALLTWPNDTDNLYLNLYAPGLTPGEDPPTAQSAGLLDGTLPYMRGYRELVVHFPEPGTWTLEVHGRTNVPTEATVEITRHPVDRPSVTIDGLTDTRVEGTTDVDTLAAPTSTGVTRAAVAGTHTVEVTGVPTDYWLHSLAGEADEVAGLFPTGGGLASFDRTEPTTPVSKVSAMEPFANPSYAANFLAAYWRGQVDGVIAGDVDLTVHLSSPTAPAFASNLTAQLFAVPEDYQGVDEARLIATTGTVAQLGAAPTEVDLTFRDVLTDDLTGRDVVVQLLTTYVDTGHLQVWHDSTLHPSRLEIPVLDPTTAPITAPDGLVATDVVGGGATLAWDPVDGASGYVVESSTSPAGPFAEVARVTGTTFADDAAPVRRSTYYRVRTTAANGDLSGPSRIVYATPVDDDALVEVQFGLGPWEPATLIGDTWFYERVGSSPEDCDEDLPGGGRSDEARNRADERGRGDEHGRGRGRGRGGGCATTLRPLPDGDVRARAGRWSTVSSTALAAR